MYCVIWEATVGEVLDWETEQGNTKDSTQCRWRKMQWLSSTSSKRRSEKAPTTTVAVAAIVTSTFTSCQGHVHVRVTKRVVWLIKRHHAIAVAIISAVVWPGPNGGLISGALAVVCAMFHPLPYLCICLQCCLHRMGCTSDCCCWYVQLTKVCPSGSVETVLVLHVLPESYYGRIQLLALPYC